MNIFTSIRFFFNVPEAFQVLEHAYLTPLKVKSEFLCSGGHY